jgi:hypothetical protein
MELVTLAPEEVESFRCQGDLPNSLKPRLRDGRIAVMVSEVRMANPEL